MRYTTLALAGIVASAAALALLAGFATTQSPLSSFYATGEAQAVSEPIDVESHLTVNSIAPAAGAQGKIYMGYVKITEPNNAQVDTVKLKVTLANAAQLRPYFDYLQLVIESKATTSGEVDEIKAVLSLEKPSAVIILDDEDLGSDNQANITVTAYYEAREGMLFDSLPVILNFQVLSVS
ncbi:hypothetical protein [Pyrodictium abyssi]|uniref:Flagellar protein FliL n=1 Tax=Pyrodictium abyssi TaxID=54256 RepID=A0ABN6ZRM5_9CREN|nr:hypothetical protein PABY_00490 [Pyrodictium abyssi]